MSEPENNNTKIWDAVQTTDPKFVKPITGKSYQGTSPNPHWLVRRATETFGPCGIGWGFTILKERIETGVDQTQIHTAHISLWYKLDGQLGNIEHVGQTVFSGFRRNGNAFTDEDAPKKSVTDALTKALSMLGFAGDIFLGRWDDSKYVESLSQPPSPPQKPKPDTWTAVSNEAIEQDQYDSIMIEAASYADDHTWDECRVWWKENLAVMEMAKEREPLKYTSIYNKFIAKKPQQN